MGFMAPFSRPLAPPFGPGLAAAAGGTIILDAFTAADGTLLTNHVISPINAIGAAWTAPFGAWTIQSNMAKADASNIGQVALVETGKADATISVVIPAVPSYPALAFRAADAQNMWLAWMGLDGRSFILVELVSGGVNVRVSTPLTYTANPYLFTATTLGSSIVISAQDTVTLITTTINHTAVANQTATKHGLFSYFPTNRFDVFTVAVP